MELYLCRNLSDRSQAYDLLAWALRRRGLPSLPPIARMEGGKPWFPDRPDCHFNLSHSGPFALCVLDDAPVGADIEAVRPHHPGLAGRICSPEELAWLDGQRCRDRALLRLWTAKECKVKYLGSGLTVPLRSIAVPLPPADTLDGLHFHFGGDEDCVFTACGRSAAAPLVTVDAREL